ncbi:uncharacterized protein [Amphiura filiformis]|uniref:uncharacterized protein n=1 Tax=Amphiura filiformis TaxID=82378 RepID=UPI003B227F36
MAHAYFASIEEELTCCVCFELFVNPHIPKDLDCPHVICEQCLAKLSKEGIIDCPECRVVTMVPTNGVSALKTNLRVRNLAEKHQRHSKILTKNPLGKHPSSSQQSKDEALYCAVHRGEKFILFCVTCNDMVCQVCVTKTHIGDEHKIKDLSAVHRGKMTIMGVNMSRSEKMASQLDKLSQELGEAEENLAASVKRQEGTIDQAVALVVANARKQGDMLKAKIRGKNQPKLDECQKQKAALQKQVRDLRKVVLDAKDIMLKSSTHEYVKHHHKQITERLKLIQSQRYVAFVDYSPYEINASVQQLARNMGTFEQDQTRQSNAAHKGPSNATGIERKPIRKLTLFTKWDGFRSVTCVASNKTSNMLAISEKDRNQVHIYGKKAKDSYRKQSVLTVPDKCGTGNCFIAVAPNGRFLVTRGKIIHVYSSSGHYQKHFHTTRNTDTVDLTCIAVNRDDKLIIGDQKRSIVTLHSLDGDLIKQVQTSIEPTCIAVINSTHVVVGSFSGNRACVVDLEAGKEVLSFDILQPLSMHYDEKTECLLVGRGAKTGVVEQWSLNSGQYIACIVQGIASPQAMTINHDGYLVVGDPERVTFYKMTYH